MGEVQLDLAAENNGHMPSYLGISRAVSGYNTLNRYDSSVRDGFRSRDNSPARFAFSFTRSRDSSPLRPEWRNHKSTSPEVTAAKIRELKEQLTRCAAQLSDNAELRSRQGSARKRDACLTQNRSVSVDRGYLSNGRNVNGHHDDSHKDMTHDISGTNGIKCSQSLFSFQHSIVRSVNGDASRTNGGECKSVIGERIERLYGSSVRPMAFRTRPATIRDASGSNGCTSGVSVPNEIENGAIVYPDVFRHLTPEFRTQLRVRQSPVKVQNDSGNKMAVKVGLDCIDNASCPSSSDSQPVNGALKNDRLIVNKTNLSEGSSIAQNSTKTLPGLSNVSLKQDARLRNLPTITKGYPKTVQESTDCMNKESSVLELKTLDESPNLSASSGRHLNGENAVLISAEFADGKQNKNSEFTKSNSSSTLQSECQEIKKSLEPFTVEDDSVQNGHYFLKLIQTVSQVLENEINFYEGELQVNGNSMSELVQGQLMAAVGKARLVLTQKLQKQFQGLCLNSISGTIGKDGSPPPTPEDLAGFWDLVSLQVNDVKAAFARLHQLQQNSWQSEVVEVDNFAQQASVNKMVKKKCIVKANSGEKSEQAKAKADERKRRLEEHRQAMRAAIDARRAQVVISDRGEVLNDDSL